MQVGTLAPAKLLFEVSEASKTFRQISQFAKTRIVNQPRRGQLTSQHTSLCREERRADGAASEVVSVEVAEEEVVEAVRVDFILAALILYYKISQTPKYNARKANKVFYKYQAAAASDSETSARRTRS